MKAQAIWWNELNENQEEFVDVVFVNEYGETTEISTYVMFNSKIFYNNSNNDNLAKFRLDDGFAPKKRRRQVNNKKLYRLIEPIYSKTEKAYSIVIGSNGCTVKSNIRLSLEWIPKSQTKVSGKNIYVSGFIASKIPVFVDYNDSVMA